MYRLVIRNGLICSCFIIVFKFLTEMHTIIFYTGVDCFYFAVLLDALVGGDLRLLMTYVGISILLSSPHGWISKHYTSEHYTISLKQEEKWIVGLNLSRRKSFPDAFHKTSSYLFLIRPVPSPGPITSKSICDSHDGLRGLIYG